jgi:hypothetical protein
MFSGMSCFVVVNTFFGLKMLFFDLVMIGSLRVGLAGAGLQFEGIEGNILVEGAVLPFKVESDTSVGSETGSSGMVIAGGDEVEF